MASKKITRDANGLWAKGQSGNPSGRPKHKFAELLAAVEKVEKKEGVNVLEHFVKVAFEDNTVLVALMRKLAPDFKAIEVETTTPADMSRMRLTEQEWLGLKKRQKKLKKSIKRVGDAICTA